MQSFKQYLEYLREGRPEPEDAPLFPADWFPDEEEEEPYVIPDNRTPREKFLQWVLGMGYLPWCFGSGGCLDGFYVGPDGGLYHVVCDPHCHLEFTGYYVDEDGNITDEEPAKPVKPEDPWDPILPDHPKNPSEWPGELPSDGVGGGQSTA